MKRTLLFVIVALTFAPVASAHLVSHSPKNATRAQTHASQIRNLEHNQYVCRHGAHSEKRWACKAVVWLTREAKETEPLPVFGVPSWFRQQALCVHRYEGPWAAATGNGFYGGMQFMLSTWAHAGGSGNPANASPDEQIYRAYVVVKRDGSWGEWPNTARVCGLL